MAGTDRAPLLSRRMMRLNPPPFNERNTVKTPPGTQCSFCDNAFANGEVGLRPAYLVEDQRAPGKRVVYCGGDHLYCRRCMLQKELDACCVCAQKFDFAEECAILHAIEIPGTPEAPAPPAAPAGLPVPIVLLNLMDEVSDVPDGDSVDDLP